MNKNIILGMIICLLFVLSLQVIYGQEVKEESEPPEMSEPSPEPFPGESEKIQDYKNKLQIYKIKN